MEALHLSQANAVTTPVVKENDRYGQLGEEICSWESMRMDSAKQQPSGETFRERKKHGCTEAQ